MYFVDLGLSKDVLKGRGTVTLAVRDLFNTRKFRSTIRTETPEERYFSERSNQWRLRQTLLTFTYRLNMKQEARDSEPSDFEED